MHTEAMTTTRVAQIAAVSFREVGTMYRVRTVTVITLADGTTIETAPGGKAYVSPTMVGKSYAFTESNGLVTWVDYP